MTKPGAHKGMTVLELMVVLAIIVMLVYGISYGLRKVTKADLVDDSLEVASTLRKASLLALETGQLHRVVFDFDKGTYDIEVCQGSGTLQRGPDGDRTADPRKVQDQLEAARQRLATAGADTGTAGAGAAAQPANADDAARTAAAIAGQHVLDRVCGPAVEDFGPDKRNAQERQLHFRKLNKESGVKWHEIWVQHVDDSVTAGIAMLYFFPDGSAEKAIVEVGAGDDVFTVLVYGLTSRVEVLDGKYDKPEDHMLRDAKGDKEAER